MPRNMELQDAVSAQPVTPPPAHGISPSPARDASEPTTEKWQPPSEFDQLKEVNAAAGRLMPGVALLLVGVTFTAGTVFFGQFLAGLGANLGSLLPPFTF